MPPPPPQKKQKNKKKRLKYLNFLNKGQRKQYLTISTKTWIHPHAQIYCQNRRKYKQILPN